MNPSSYEQVKVTPITSSPPTGPLIDSLEILMRGIITRTDKWLEWTRERRRMIVGWGLFGGTTSSPAQSTSAATSSIAPSTSTGETQSIRQGGDQPLEKNIPITYTYDGGFLPNTRKVREKEGDKDKEKKKEKKKEQEMFMTKLTSPIHHYFG